MGREATSVTPGRQPGLILTGGHGWQSAPIRVAVGRRMRRLGLTPNPGPFGLLIRTASIHSFGMREPLGWVALDDHGVVLAAGTLPPNRVLAIRGARFILEQSPRFGLPMPGESTRAVPHGLTSDI